MKTPSKRTLLITAIVIATLSGSYCAFYGGALGGQKEMAEHRTPDQAWAWELKRIQNSGRQPSSEEEEVIKMSLWMSYLTDKITTPWLKQLDNRWSPPLDLHDPTWPSCGGGISRFLDLNPPPRRKGIDENLRPYVFVDGTKAELVNEPTPVPWSGGWGRHWQNDAAQKEFDIDAKWFRYPDALGKVHGRGKMGAWPTGDEASYGQVHGEEVAAIIRYAIQHGSFSGAVIGDDSFFLVGSWFGVPGRYSEFKHAWLAFRKYNFRVTINVMPTSDKIEPATDEERAMIERVARLVEAQIIAYSLFGLEKFTVLQTQVGDKDLYLPAGRVGAGNYLVPVGYVTQRVTGQRPVYEAATKQMRVNVKGQRANLSGEVIQAANRWVEIPEAERLVASLSTLQESLGMGAVQDVRFEK
ncbi:MAG: hypothetical protein ABIN58_06600 [candidate division WOR-3 bacterium]